MIAVFLALKTLYLFGFLFVYVQSDRFEHPRKGPTEKLKRDRNTTGGTFPTLFKSMCTGGTTQKGFFNYIFLTFSTVCFCIRIAVTSHLCVIL
jgi:hypothetical protein